MMNNISAQFRTKLCLCLVKKQSPSTGGFTLLELMIVMIFISIFAAIALPNLIRQAGKAREVEFKNVIATVNRAQQTYHWEKQLFAQGANDAESIDLLNVDFDNSYIDSYNITAYTTHATIALTNSEYEDDQTRAYSGGTYYNAGFYSIVICQSALVADSLAEPISASECPADGELVR